MGGIKLQTDWTVYWDNILFIPDRSMRVEKTRTVVKSISRDKIFIGTYLTYAECNFITCLVTVDFIFFWHI